MADHLSFYDKELRPWPNPRLKRAAIVGHTTTRTSRLWVRTSEPGKFWLAVSSQPLPTTGEPEIDGAARLRIDGELIGGIVFLKRHDFQYATDCTHVFPVSGLTAHTKYFYRVFSDASRSKPDGSPRTRWELGWQAPHEFRTLPAAPKEITFGLFSCHKPYDNRLNLIHLDLWDHFYKELDLAGAGFVIGGGDQVYTDGHEKLSIWSWLKKVMNDPAFPTADDEQRELMVSWYRDIYRGYWGPESVRRLFRSFPTYMTWDDHELMDGWGSYTSKELDKLLNRFWSPDPASDIPRKRKIISNMIAAAQQVYTEYEHSHNPKGDDFDYSFKVGDFAFYVLDARGHRDFTAPGKPILGAAQTARFNAWLDQCTAKAIFIVSAVPVVHASNFVVNTLDIPWIGLADDLRDEWEHKSHWKERDAMLKKVFSHSHQRKTKIAFLSGDVHIGAAFALSQKRFPDARVYQFTSSAITWSSTEGELLRLILKKNGALGGGDGSTQDTEFQLLHIADDNNFAIVQAGPSADGSEIKIRWSLYQDAHKDGEISRLTPVEV